MKKTSFLLPAVLIFTSVFCIYPRSALMSSELCVHKYSGFSLVSSTITENMDDTAIGIGIGLLIVINVTLIILKTMARSKILRKAQKYDELMEEKEQQERRNKKNE